MGFNTQAQVLPAKKSQRITASEAVTFAEEVVAPTVFHADTTGTLTARLVKDTTDQTFQVVAGAMYPLHIISIPVTNAVAGVLMWTTEPRPTPPT